MGIFESLIEKQVTKTVTGEVGTVSGMVKQGAGKAINEAVATGRDALKGALPEAPTGDGIGGQVGRIWNNFIGGKPQGNGLFAPARSTGMESPIDTLTRNKQAAEAAAAAAVGKLQDAGQKAAASALPADLPADLRVIEEAKRRADAALKEREAAETAAPQKNLLERAVDGVKDVGGKIVSGATQVAAGVAAAATIATTAAPAAEAPPAPPTTTATTNVRLGAQHVESAAGIKSDASPTTDFKRVADPVQEEKVKPTSPTPGLDQLIAEVSAEPSKRSTLDRGILEAARAQISNVSKGPPAP